MNKITKRMWHPRRNRRKGKTGFKGVTPNGNGFRAEIYYQGKRINIGTYPTALEAAIAWDQEALKIFGARPDLNFGIPETFIPHQVTIAEYDERLNEPARKD
jgi:hypothetical protein